jgi:AcrR family transcriptional regulator
MKVSGQDPERGKFAEHGRVNQKRRTRSAIVDAAVKLMGEGVTPTVGQAAEAALVSRATAYRYFPTQDSLLLEVAMHADVEDIEEVVQQPVDAEHAAARAVQVLQLFNQHVLTEEAKYRNGTRAYMDAWLAGSAGEEPSPVLREGRRRRWLTTSLEPLREQFGAERFQRLVAALSVLGGMEPISVLLDICRLTPEDALAVTEWAARTLIDATLAAEDPSHA